MKTDPITKRKSPRPIDSHAHHVVLCRKGDLKHRMHKAIKGFWTCMLKSPGHKVTTREPQFYPKDDDTTPRSDVESMVLM